MLVILKVRRVGERMGDNTGLELLMLHQCMKMSRSFLVESMLLLLKLLKHTCSLVFNG